MSEQFDGGFVEVYSTATGDKQMVPKHFMDNEVLSRGLSLTPSGRAADTGSPSETAGNTYAGDGPGGFPLGDPSKDWKADQLDAFAAARGVDVTGASNKSEVLSAIQNHLASGEGTAVDQTDDTEGA